MKLTIIFPALNESAVIETTLKEGIAQLKRLGLPYEVLVVDNASSDNTVALVEAFASHEPNVRVIRHERNMGYAHSNLTGFQHATGDLVAVADSDGQHTLADLPLFIAKIRDGADVVYGWRQERHDALLRKVISSGLSVASGVLLGWKLHDINCGFRVVTSAVARSMTKVHPVNYFGPELWVHAVNHHFTVAEVIVHHAERRGGTSIHAPWRLPRTIMKSFHYLFALRGELRAAPASATGAISESNIQR